MAEGGKRQRSFKDSFSKASGDADELFCDPCKSEGNWIAVEGYCQICEEYMCEHCLRVHRKQKMTRAHAILDRQQMPRRRRSESNQDLCVEVCKTHHPEIIRFYCKAHDEPGCGDCMTLKHKTCERDRVQDISDGFKNSIEFVDIDLKLQQLHTVLEEMEDVLDNNLKNHDTKSDNILLTITSVRKQINDYLDQMQKKITDEAAQMKKDEETKLKKLLAENHAMKVEIDVMLQRIHDSNTNVNSLFVISKQAEQRLVSIEMEVNMIKQQQQYEFLISNEIEKIFSTKTPLGKFARQTTQQIMMENEQDQKTSRKPTIDTKAAHNKRISVEGYKDRCSSCCIKDCTLLSPDRLVVIDKENNNVKLIDISNDKVISSYSPLSAPEKVTALSTSVIAVTLSRECKIQLLDVTATFALQREIEISNISDGIAYKDGKFAVSYKGLDGVEILDIKGKILHTIQIKRVRNFSMVKLSGKPFRKDSSTLSQNPYFIAFGHGNDTVIVSECLTNKVSVVTFSGRILHTYKHDALIRPHGMAITADGVLYVCSRQNGCIHVVSPDFKSSKIIINNQNSVVHPESITYCDINHRLYISNTDAPGNLSNRIQVYDLNV